MSLSLVSNIVENSLTGIEAEVSELRDQANNRIGSREYARQFINEHLAEMPTLVIGEFTSSFVTERGQTEYKSQSKNLALWCVALQTTVETGYSSYQLLASIFRTWSQETLGHVWDDESSLKVATRFIDQMRAMSILDMNLTKIPYTTEDGENKETRVVMLTDSFKHKMGELVEEMREHTSMICKPLTNKPQDWTDLNNGIGEQANIPLIKNYEGDSEEIAQPVLDAVNKLQSVKFIIAPCIADAAQDMLDNPHEFNLSDEDTRLFTAILEVEKKEMYFPVTMDQRGRMYYRGGLITPQGEDFCKAAFQFAEFKQLGEHGLDAIAIHLANCIGYDKLSINDRLDRVKAHIDAKDFAIEDFTEVTQKFPNADQWQAYVAITELNRILALIEQGQEPSLISSNLVCHQDGTCNGLQHMAAITKNRQTAETVNCTASTWHDVPADIYGIIAKEAEAILHDKPEALALVKKYGRSMAKNPVMITGYGAGQETLINNTVKYLQDKGEDSNNGDVIGQAYIQALGARAGAVKQLTTALKTRVESFLLNGGDVIKWTTADGFKAATKYKDQEINRVRAGVFNALVKNMKPAPLDEVKTIGAKAPNFIHSIDATHLRMVINKANFNIVAVHDSIGSHPGNFFATSRIIREEFKNVHEYDAMANLCEFLEVRPAKFRGTYSASEALNSSYIFS